MTIKTVYIPAGGGFDHVSIETSPPADPAPGEITVRLRASSLNFHDYMVVKGITGPKERRIPMSDGAGEVIAVGEGVDEFSVGDHVVSTFFPDWLDGEPQAEGFGRVPGDGIDGYAREQVTAPATAFTHAPRGWSHAEAATLTTAGLTAWRALFVDAALKPGSVVLVQGTGGADPEWGMTARRLTDGRGVDHVLDVGGPDTLAQSMLAARVGGHVALIGVLSGVDGQLPLGLALGRQLRLQALIVGSRHHQQEMVRALEASTLRPVIDRHFALEDIVAAFRHQESGSHFGKIVLDI